MENALLNLFNQNLANKATDLYNQRQRDLVNQAAMDVFSTGFNNRNTGIMSQASRIPLPEFDMANLPMYETDDEQDQEYINQVNQSNNKFGGIMDLLMGIAIPGYGLFKNIAQGGLEGLRGFNQRLQQSDFGQSDNFAEFLKIKRDREALARDPNIFQDARGITKSLASRPSSTSGGYQQGPGGSGAQSTAASRSQSQAGPGFSGSGSAAEMGSF